jgi:hypothetical protein
MINKSRKGVITPVCYPCSQWFRDFEFRATFSEFNCLTRGKRYQTLFVSFCPTCQGALRPMWTEEQKEE